MRTDYVGQVCEAIMKLGEKRTMKAATFSKIEQGAREAIEIESLRAIISRLRDELAELRKPDCRTCVSYGAHAGCPLARAGCVDGSMYVAGWSEPYPVRLYETDAAMAGGER